MYIACTSVATGLRRLATQYTPNTAYSAVDYMWLYIQYLLPTAAACNDHVYTYVYKHVMYMDMYIVYIPLQLSPDLAAA